MSGFSTISPTVLAYLSGLEELRSVGVERVGSVPNKPVPCFLKRRLFHTLDFVCPPPARLAGTWMPCFPAYFLRGQGGSAHVKRCASESTWYVRCRSQQTFVPCAPFAVGASRHQEVPGLLDALPKMLPDQGPKVALEFSLDRSHGDSASETVNVIQ